MSRLVRPAEATTDGDEWLAELRHRMDLETAWTVVNGCYACHWGSMFSAKDWQGLEVMRRVRGAYSGLGQVSSGHPPGCGQATPGPNATLPSPLSYDTAKALLDEAYQPDRAPAEGVESLDVARRRRSKGSKP